MFKLLGFVIIFTGGSCAMNTAHAQTIGRLPTDGGKLVTFDAAHAGSQPYVGGTYPLANNDEGIVVGYYVDVDEIPHGFVRSLDGHVSSFDAPGAGLGAGLDQGTAFYSINDFGVIAGQFEDSNNIYHGFVRYPDNHYEVFEAPNAGKGNSQGTQAFSINLQGAATGISIDGGGVYHGFVRSSDGSHIDVFDPAGSTYTYPCEETCINDVGQIVGFYLDANSVFHGFVREPNGYIKVIDGPHAGTTAYTGTYAASINARGDITGYTIDANGLLHGYTRHRNGNFEEFESPDTATGVQQGVASFSINPRLNTAGVILSPTGVYTGFSRSDRGEVQTFSVAAGGEGAGQGTRPSTNNAFGEVTGWYIDSGNVGHGFIWIPRDDWR